MQQNINPYICSNPHQQIPLTPNAVNINIIQPQAYGSSDEKSCYKQNYYPLYQANTNTNLPLYPSNYNNMIQYQNIQQQPNSILQYRNDSNIPTQPNTNTAYNYAQNPIQPNIPYSVPYNIAAQPYSAPLYNNGMNMYQQPYLYNNGINNPIAPQASGQQYQAPYTQAYPAGYNNGIIAPQQQYANIPNNNANIGYNQSNADLLNPPAQQNGINSAQNQNIGNNAQAYNSTNLIEKTKNPIDTQQETTNKNTKKTDKKEEEKPKTITILTDNYIKSLENYLNDSNPKMRLIAAKEVMERFKEDDSRISNPSLCALLNKMLRDTSPSVRFLALTTLKLGYSIGNNETVDILKNILASNQDKIGEDAVLASEILLKLSAPKVKEVK